MIPGFKGCIVTMDAMGCQKEIARQIVDQGADYVLALKGNQGAIHDEVRLFFEYAQEKQFKDIPHGFYEVTDGGHGRVEVRRYYTVSEIDWLEEKPKWKNLNLIGMVESERHIGEKITKETRYFLSSLPNDTKRFAEAVRDHWRIENQLHWVLDIDGDRCGEKEAQPNGPFLKLSRLHKPSLLAGARLPAPFHANSFMSREALKTESVFCGSLFSPPP